MINGFEPECAWKRVWFSDEARLSLRPTLNTQNDRIYREVRLKTDIPEADRLLEYDNLQPFVLCYAAVSWFGKTELRFLEGYYQSPEGRKKKQQDVSTDVQRYTKCNGRPNMDMAAGWCQGSHSKGFSSISSAIYS